MKRARIALVLLLVITLFSMIACTPCSVCGIYINELDAGEYIVIETDGDFSIIKGQFGTYGIWDVSDSGDTLSLRYKLAIAASELQIRGDTLIESDGTRWTRK